MESPFDLDLFINKNPPPPVLRRPDAGPIRPQRDESRVLLCDPLSKDGSGFPGASAVRNGEQSLAQGGLQAIAIGRFQASASRYGLMTVCTRQTSA